MDNLGNTTGHRTSLLNKTFPFNFLKLYFLSRSSLYRHLKFLLNYLVGLSFPKKLDVSVPWNMKCGPIEADDDKILADIRDNKPPE